MDVWYQARPAGMEPMRRSFQIVGTGQPIPTHLGLYLAGSHKGTAISPDGQLVWHVLENYCPHAETPGEQPTPLPGDCPGCRLQLLPHPEHEWMPA